ncbi:MAG: lysoplasmalogenase [Leptospiraceae bacterium]
MSSQLFLYVFFALSAIHVIGEFLQDPLRKRIRISTKPLLMPALIAYNLLHTSDPNWWIVGGLLLGWVGDVVLMFPRIAIMFLIGLASFLVGHALFIYAFLESTAYLQGMPIWFMGLSAVFAFAAAAFFTYFKPHLTGDNADKKIPVALYASIIVAMSYTSLAIWLNGSGSGIFFVALPFIGSLCFIVSDFLLANQLFIKPFKYDQAIIMLTYLAAQYSIAQGYLPYPFG